MTGLPFMNVPISDKGLAALKGHASIESILLNRTSVTDLGLMHLGTLPNLEKISIDYGNVTDVGLGTIAEMKIHGNVQTSNR
jgi:hypothetical protein